MKSIMMTYPDFQGLPNGVKRLLVTSEDFFFTVAIRQAEAARPEETDVFVPNERGQPDDIALTARV